MISYDIVLINKIRDYLKENSSDNKSQSLVDELDEMIERWEYNPHDFTDDEEN